MKSRQLVDVIPEVCRHLRFIAYLNAHPEDVQFYSELKKQLAQKHPDDISSYILGKESWIKQIDRLAAKEKVPPSFLSSYGA